MKEEPLVNAVSPFSEQVNTEATYQTGFVLWRAAENGFAGWAANGVSVNPKGALILDRAMARAESDPYPAGTYQDGNYYNGGSFFLGEATSPEIKTAFDY